MPDATVDERGANLVFIVGSPRSGTTWLARLMGAHDGVVASQETELVSRYLQSWYDVWRQQLPDDTEAWARHRHRGLPAVLTSAEFDERLRDFARGVYDKLLVLKPTVHVVVDKTPENGLHMPLIRRLFPDAAVLHIIRDGRDVAASMLAASRGWGRDWAPAQVRLAAETWRTCVESASAAATSGRYLCVRYEDLLASGADVLADCLEFAGVPVTAAECAEICARFELTDGAAPEVPDSLVWSGEVVRRLGATPSEPTGFFGSGGAGGWQEIWTARDRLDFDTIAGDLLRSLGYATDSGWLEASELRRRRAAAMARVKERAVRLGWRLHLSLGRRGLYVHVARIEPYQRASKEHGSG